MCLAGFILGYQTWFGLTRVCTLVPNLVGFVVLEYVLGYVPGYQNLVGLVVLEYVLGCVPGYSDKYPGTRMYP